MTGPPRPAAIEYRRRVRRTLVAVVLMALVGAAHAQPSMTEPVSSPPPAKPRRYGGWMAAADLGGTLAILVIGASSGDEEFWWVWAGSYLATGPIVHAANGEPGKGLGSLLLRASAPVAGAWIGFELEEGDGGELDGLGGFILGGGIGIVTAWAVDWTVLARKDVDDAPRAQVLVTPTEGGATIGLAGAF